MEKFAQSVAVSTLGSFFASLLVMYVVKQSIVHSEQNIIKSQTDQTNRVLTTMTGKLPVSTADIQPNVLNAIFK